MAWGLLPILYSHHGLSVGQVGTLAALYPAVWGAGQLAIGALSDRHGRKWLIASGMWLQAGAIALVAGLLSAIWTVAAITAASGVVVAARMYETLRRPATTR